MACAKASDEILAHWDGSSRAGITSGKSGAERDETRKAEVGCVKRPSAKEAGLYHEGSGKALASFNREVMWSDCTLSIQHAGNYSTKE